MIAKKILPLLIFALVFISACSSTSNEFTNQDSNKIKIVTSFYPLFDFAQKIGGDYVHVINLVPAGVEPHDWNPKAGDIKNITEAQLFIYNGLGFEGWLNDVMSSMDTNVTKLQASEGIEYIRVQEDQEKEADEHAEEDNSEYDPHVWLSPLSAITMAENIKNSLIGIAPEYRDQFEANYKILSDDLINLHRMYGETASKAKRKEFVVSHSAFAYLARDYELEQLAIMGLTPDAEPTPQDLMVITDFIKENNVTYILFEELVSPKLARTLAEDLNIETLVFNPVEGLTEEQQASGEDYISVMQKNLVSLRKVIEAEEQS